MNQIRKRVYYKLGLDYLSTIIFLLRLRKLLRHYRLSEDQIRDVVKFAVCVRFMEMKSCQ